MNWDETDEGDNAQQSWDSFNVVVTQWLPQRVAELNDLAAYQL